MKFDEKSKIDNPIRNHTQSFQRIDEVLINLGLIKSFFDV